MTAAKKIQSIVNAINMKEERKIEVAEIPRANVEVNLKQRVTATQSNPLIERKTTRSMTNAIHVGEKRKAENGEIPHAKKAKIEIVSKRPMTAAIVVNAMNVEDKRKSEDADIPRAQIEISSKRQAKAAQSIPLIERKTTRSMTNAKNVA